VRGFERLYFGGLETPEPRSEPNVAALLHFFERNAERVDNAVIGSLLLNIFSSPWNVPFSSGERTS